MIDLRDWIKGIWRGFSEWVSNKDICERCGNEWTDYTCVGCERRICCMCESGYYEDANLCSSCRHDITPEEEEEDRKLAAELDGDTE